MNISFSSRSIDKCSLCNEHKSCNENCTENCEICKNWKIHIRFVKIATNKSRLETEIQYQNTCEISNYPKFLVISADMQKMLQIPILKENSFAISLMFIT
jgi:hypothetical protein